MPHVCRARSRRGSSLIEVLFALFMLVAAALVVSATMPVATISQGKANYQFKAMSLAQRQLEAIRGLGYANATPTQLASFGLIDSTVPITANTYTFSNVDSAIRDDVARVLPSGEGRVTLENLGLDTRQITVTIRWRDRGVQQSFSLGTVVANL